MNLKEYFQYLRVIKNFFLQIENPWHLEITIITYIQYIYNIYPKFGSYFQREEKKRKQNKYIEFWNEVLGKYKTIQKCVHLFLIMFTSTYLYETSYSKMK